MNDVIANYPVPWLRPLLRVLVFPLGLRLAPPGDLLGQQVSQTITQPGVVRDTLTRGIYLNLDPEDAVGRVLNAFKLQTETAHLQEKLHRAVRESDQTETIKDLEMLLEKQRDKKLQWAEENGVLSQDETRQLSAAMSAIYDALRVDSFAGKAATATKKAQTKALQNAS